MGKILVQCKAKRKRAIYTFDKPPKLRQLGFSEPWFTLIFVAVDMHELSWSDLDVKAQYVWKLLLNVSSARSLLSMMCVYTLANTPSSDGLMVLTIQHV